MKATWNGTVIANSENTILLERSDYFPPQDVNMDFLRRSSHTHQCPQKGEAIYYDVLVQGTTLDNAAWSYLSPGEDAAAIAGHITFSGDIEVLR